VQKCKTELIEAGPHSHTDASPSGARSQSTKSKIYPWFCMINLLSLSNSELTILIFKVTYNLNIYFFGEYRHNCVCRKVFDASENFFTWSGWYNLLKFYQFKDTKFCKFQVKTLKLIEELFLFGILVFIYFLRLKMLYY
jgi:hypothetical protein